MYILNVNGRRTSPGDAHWSLQIQFACVMQNLGRVHFPPPPPNAPYLKKKERGGETRLSAYDRCRGT